MAVKTNNIFPEQHSFTFSYLSCVQ